MMQINIPQMFYEIMFVNESSTTTSKQKYNFKVSVKCNNNQESELYHHKQTSKKHEQQ
jgi:hypothetical protein